MQPNIALPPDAASAIELDQRPKPELSLRWCLFCVVVSMLSLSCSVNGEKETPPITGSSPSSTASSPIGPSRIPLGDGKISTLPQVGAVFVCQTRFMGGGAFRDGPWIKADGTWDSTAKAVVDGEIMRPVEGEIMRPSRPSIREENGRRLVETAGLPDHPTGAFPVQPEDDAFQYDRNPNTIAPQELRFDLPLEPAAAAQASCLPMGPIGVLVTGSVFFDALDAQGKDAVAHELQDRCHGHPERTGVYHYHDLTPCLNLAGNGHSALAGYAFDGFGIYGPWGVDGRDLSNADLDECHGHSHAVEWNGSRADVYHYHATLEYPYTLGCYRGAPAVRPGS